MGLGGALFEAIRFRGRQDHQPAFSQLSRAALPRHAGDRNVLVDRKDLPVRRRGRDADHGIAPAIGNAIFDATKVRLTNLPLHPERYLA